MRQQIDCAALILAAQQSWMPQVLKDLEPALARVKLHLLEWEAGHDLDLEQVIVGESNVSLPIETLAQAKIGLRRYDALLIPVTMETLAWTRQALSVIPRGPFIPMIGVLRDMRSPAIQDLLEMGMSDFVRWPVCPEEFRARLLNTVSVDPRPGILREPSLNYRQSIALARGVLPAMNESTLHEWLERTRLRRSRSYTYPESHVRKALEGILPPSPAEQEQVDGALYAPEDKSETEGVLSQGEKTGTSKNTASSDSIPITHGGSMKAMKAKIIEDFEREYIIEALIQNKGNIGLAAIQAGKHRRAFWALMIKYEIDAADFKKKKRSTRRTGGSEG
jgi:hypothetical protein